jgi:hypothetical protein
VTYGGVDELLSPCDEICFLRDMGIGTRLHELEEHSFAFAEVCRHDGLRWSEMVDDGS